MEGIDDSLASSEGNKTVPIKYENGSFIKEDSNSRQSLPDMDTW